MKPKVLVDGRRLEPNGEVADLAEVEPGVWSVMIENRVTEVCLSGGQAWVNGRAICVEVEDPREFSAAATSAASAGRREIKAPMPGRVIRVLIAVNDEVVAGQGLLVVEAMKMQNEMPAPKAGRVTSVSVKAGDAVAAGQLLAVLE